MPAALTQRLARFCIHGDRDVGMQDVSLGRERGVMLELCLDARPVADEQEARVGMADERDRGARKDHAWSMVAAHGVERYGDWSSHLLPCR